MQDHHQLKQPQYNGVPGWLFLTHDEQFMPVALFVDQQQNLTMIHVVLDERLFSDTLFRVVRVAPTRFLVYDIRYMNGIDVYSDYTFTQRKERILELLDLFHHPDLISLEPVSPELSNEFTFRGFEFYDDQPGTLGVFLPVKE